MYTSDTDKANLKLREPMVWAGITAFCILFAAVYEHFSFGVYSNSMIFMFMYPLIFGLIPSLVLALKAKAPLTRLWNDGVITVTLASLIRGILEIYGTESQYTGPFMLLGVALLILGLVRMVMKSRQN